ncbi:MAG: short-chain dehydrogenase [Bacteroidetes bacterium]|nr:short-chain dehydrogenase [Bacteroidota bacterium]
MTNDQIEKFILGEGVSKRNVTIHFKTRNPLTGLFIKTADYDELKSKNFWRIVTGPSIEVWKKSQDASLARIFNGSEITKLTLSAS